MEKLTLSQIAAAVGSRCESKTEVLSICTDTRKIEPGSLFIAIQGENFDGNRFVGQAFEKGAVLLAAAPDIFFLCFILISDPPAPHTACDAPHTCTPDG